MLPGAFAWVTSQANGEKSERRIQTFNVKLSFKLRTSEKDFRRFVISAWTLSFLKSRDQILKIPAISKLNLLAFRHFSALKTSSDLISQTLPLEKKKKLKFYARSVTRANGYSVSGSITLFHRHPFFSTSPSKDTNGKILARAEKQEEDSKMIAKEEDFLRYRNKGR